MLMRDREKHKARAAAPEGSLHTWARSMEAARTEENAACEERARQRAEEAEALREAEQRAQESARRRAAAEAESEWQDELLRQRDTEQQQILRQQEAERLARQQEEDAQQQEEARQAQYIEMLHSEHERQLASHRMSAQLSAYIEKPLDSLTDASLAELRTLVARWSDDIQRESDSRKTPFHPSPPAV